MRKLFPSINTPNHKPAFKQSRTWSGKKLIESLKKFLSQGITPEQLALTVVLGTALGIIPVLGVTTVLCAAAALYFRLNMIAIQLINWFVYPLQLILYIPFIKLGELIFYGETVFPFSPADMITMIRGDWWRTVIQFWLSNLMGVFAWLLVMIPVSVLLYYLSLGVFMRFSARNGKVTTGEN
ncbi:MAG TPA: DUF2062 domain-containing protein [Bacteroidetes bacterium]|nr:DUF2062 domain-containing protein [Bacteroidota bacterium]